MSSFFFTACRGPSKQPQQIVAARREYFLSIHQSYRREALVKQGIVGLLPQYNAKRPISFQSSDTGPAVQSGFQFGSIITAVAYVSLTYELSSDAHLAAQTSPLIRGPFSCEGLGYAPCRVAGRVHTADMQPGKSGAAASPTDLELQPILTGQASPRRDRSKAARARQILRDPVTRAALGNLALILTWQVALVLSTWAVSG